MLRIFDIFKIGIGPSSSHTVGPMKVGKHFSDDLISLGYIKNTTCIVVDIYGSLSLTAKSNHTDIAIIIGLAGNLPESVNIEGIQHVIANVEKSGRLMLANGTQEIDFPLTTSINFHRDNLALHESSIRITALNDRGTLYNKTYYLTSNGFITDEGKSSTPEENPNTVPYTYYSAKDILRHCNNTGLSLTELMLQNELIYHSQTEINTHFDAIWQVMREGIERGIRSEGILPGAMKVPRRAAALRNTLMTQDKNNIDPIGVIDWINMFAMAVSEENAAGGRVVTAPTNGACGIIPAVLAYYDRFIHPLSRDLYSRFFLAAGAVGVLFKMNASISGAEVGCQGEVGVTCSMAAAGLTELLGGSAAQVFTAAEIAMEHHLGLTCSPLANQVQVPCIERNAISAVKAVNASRMALRRISEPQICLDKVIETMYETGKDMKIKYREGLAIKVLPCH